MRKSRCLYEIHLPEDPVFNTKYYLGFKKKIWTVVPDTNCSRCLKIFSTPKKGNLVPG